MKLRFLNIYLLFFAISAFAQVEKRPNIVVILADDLGYSDIGCYGSEIPTPNLDKLAANGLRLNNFYNGARCCPTRASLLTGLYAHETGIGYMTGNKLKDNPAYQGFLNDKCVTIAETMQSAGYFTIMAGKWHLGHNQNVRPSNRGFMRSLHAPAGGFYFSQDTKVKLFENDVLVKNGKEIPKDWYSTDLWTSTSLKYIDESLKSKKPFLLYLSHNAPHFPLQAPAEDIKKFRGKYLSGWDEIRKNRFAKQKELGIIDENCQLTPSNPIIYKWDTLSNESKNKYDHMMAIYAATISRLDKSVGDLVQGLKDRGQFENTIIVFLSDNGGNAEPGIQGTYKGKNPGDVNSSVFIGQGWAEVGNTPFWLYKHNTSEGGIASPCIIHYPSGMNQSLKGTINKQPFHIIDIMPTILDLGKGTYPKSFKGNAILPIEGVSMKPLIEKKQVVRSVPLYWEHEGNRAMRDGKWKIVSNLSEKWQLYNLDLDRSELNDLSLKQPEVLNDMVQKYDKWYEKVGAKPYFTQTMKWHYNILNLSSK